MKKSKSDLMIEKKFCKKCGGAGMVLDLGGYEPCEECGGTGEYFAAVGACLALAGCSIHQPPLLLLKKFQWTISS